MSLRSRAGSGSSDARRRLRLALLIALAVVALGGLSVGAIAVLNATVQDAPNVKQPAVVWAVGDAGDGSEEAMGVADLVEQDSPDRFLYLGDVYEEGTAEEFDENYDTVFGDLTEVTEPTPGNHDWPNAEEGYFPYWEEVRGEELPPYYSFELAGWEILSLNSEDDTEEGSAQLEWLERRLDARGTCRLAFWHRPRYSAGETNGPDRGVEPFWDALRGRAALVVNGHEHLMQRFDPIRGITELGAGAGGHGLYPLDEDEPRLAFAENEEYGALRLELEPGLARYEFVTIEGETLDSGEVDCEEIPS